VYSNLKVPALLLSKSTLEPVAMLLL